MPGVRRRCGSARAAGTAAAASHRSSAHATCASALLRSSIRPACGEGNESGEAMTNTTDFRAQPPEAPALSETHTVAGLAICLPWKKGLKKSSRCVAGTPQAAEGYCSAMLARKLRKLGIAIKRIRER